MSSMVRVGMMIHAQGYMQFDGVIDASLVETLQGNEHMTKDICTQEIDLLK